MAGETDYIAHTFLVSDWPIFIAAWIFLIMAIRAYVKWGRDQPLISE